MTGEKTLSDLVAEIAGHGERPAIVSLASAERWSYAELGQRIRRLAAGLRAAGLKPGEPVALLAPNRPQWVAAALALPAAGGAVVPLDLMMAPEDLRHALLDSGCRRIFTTGDRLEGLARALGGEVRLETILLDTDADSAAGRSWRALLGPDPGGLPPARAGDTAAIFYTSGTTGRPKGVPLSHRNLRFNLEGLLAAGILGPGERVLVPLPLYHVYPFMVGMLGPLAAGAMLVFPAGVSGPQVVEALRAERATAIVGVPRLYAALADAIRAGIEGRGRAARAALSALLGLSIAVRRRTGLAPGRLLFAGLRRRIGPGLRTLASGGAPLDPEVAWMLEGLGFEVLSGYGLTETSPIVAFNARGRSRIEAVGRVLAGLEVRIEGADSGGTGEIQVRGPSVFAGYLDNPEATAQAFAAGGWFRTGDLGRFDGEEFLYVSGRRSERIVLADGKNVAPEEVEGVYALQPGIAEVGLVEVGGALVALVRPDLKALRAAGASDLDASVREAVRAAGAALAPYKRVTDFALVREPLPRTPLGKLKRFALPGLYREARAAGGRRAAPAPLSEADRALLAAPAARRVWDYLEVRYAGRNLSLDADPRLDLGIDSLAWVGLSLKIEEDLGVRLTESALAEIETVRDLIEAVAAAARGAGPAPAPERLSPEQLRWIDPRGPALAAAAFALFGLIRLVMHLAFRLKAEGAARLPAEGPLIVTPNHASYLDSFALAAALPWAAVRRLSWAGIVAILFTSRLRRLFSRIAGVFPVDPERAPASTLAFGKEALARGRILVWYPEGGRTPDGALKRFLPGIGIVAAETGAPCLPVHIGGTFAAWPLSRRFPRLKPVRVVFGAPLAPAALAARGEGASAEERIANALHDAVAGLGRGAGGGA